MAAETDSCLDARESKEAITACTAKIDAGEEDPVRRAMLFERRALAYEALHDGDRALADYNALIALQPDNAYARNLRAYKRYARRDYRGAIEDFTVVVQRRPIIRLPSLFWRGLSYEGTGEIDLAIADYDQIIEAEPNFREVHAQRAFAYMKRGEWDRARRDLAKERELLSEPVRRLGLAVEAVWAQGIVAFALGDYAEAVTRLRGSNTADKVLWTYAAMVRNGDDTQGHPYNPSKSTARFNFRPDPKWPKPIIAALRAGTALDKSFLSTDPRIRRERQVQWAFYRAIAALDAGDAAKSRALLEEAVALGPAHVIEYHLAKAELARLP